MKKENLQKRKYMWIISGCITLFVCLILISGITVSAQDETDEQRTVRVVFPEQDGISFSTEKGDYAGYTYEYLQKIAEFTGWNLEYITYPDMSSDDAIMKAMTMVESGDADLMGVTLKSDALEESYEYPEKNYGVVYTVLSVLESNTELNESNFMLKAPLRVAVLEKAKTRKSELTDYLERSGVTYELVNCSSVEEQYQMMVEGKADAMLRLSLGYMSGTKRIASFAPRPFYFVSTKGNTELMDELDETIAQISAAFPYFQDELAEKYFGDSTGKFEISEQEQEYLGEKKTLNVLCTINEAPFVFQDKKGNLQGMSIDVCNEFARKAGLDVKYTTYDYSQNFTDFYDSGNYDLVLGVPLNASYGPKLGLIGTTPFMTTDTVMYAKAENIAMDSEQRTVALVKGSDQADSLTAKEFVYFQTLEECMRAVRDGKADCGYANSRSVDYYNYELYANLTTVPVPGTDQGIGFFVARENDPKLVILLNRYLRSVDATDMYTYYAQILTSGQINTIESFARQNPIQAVLLVGIVSTMIFSIMMLLVFYRATQKKNKQLGLAIQAKSDFLSRMSHDMRTPMNAIIGLSNLAIDSRDEAERLEFLHNINTSGSYLLGLINDTLDMSKIDSDKMVLQPELCYQREFVQMLYTLFADKAKKKNMNLRITSEHTTDIPILIDRLRLQQIVVNLMNNAIKFTPVGGTVEAQIDGALVEEEQILITIVIRDNGIGMKPEFQKKMYEAFEQESAGMSVEGTGLGLSIVKKLVTLFDGTITCKSKEHEGTEFTVQIKAKAGKKEILPEQSKISPDQWDVLDGKKVLLCEDHPINVQVAKKILEKKGIVVDVAEDGQKGVELFTKSQPGQYAVILMDIRMPVLNGMQAAEQIRQLDRADAQTIPIIAMTANAFEEDRKKALDSGMNEHLSKPIEPEKLYTVLAQFIIKNQ